MVKEDMKRPRLAVAVMGGLWQFCRSFSLSLGWKQEASADPNKLMELNQEMLWSVISRFGAGQPISLRTRSQIYQLACKTAKEKKNEISPKGMQGYAAIAIKTKGEKSRIAQARQKMLEETLDGDERKKKDEILEQIYKIKCYKQVVIPDPKP